MKAVKTIFFDRDGVINEVVVRGATVSSPRSLAEFIIRPDFLEFYRAIQALSLNLFVVSNQPDVARQLMSADDLENINEMIARHVSFREVRYCIHDNEHDCLCRKPKPGMLIELLDKYNLSADEAIIIGDSYKDILAGDAAGVSTVYLLGSYNATIKCKPSLIVSSLREIIQHYTFCTVAKA